MNYALVKDGVVENIVLWDGEGDLFEDCVAVNIEGLSVGVGWTYDGKNFIAPVEPPPPPLSHDGLVEQAEFQKQTLIIQANEYIDSRQWPSKLALGRLNDDDKAQFNEWLDYLDALEAVDPTLAPDIAWPEMPVV